MYPEKIHYLMHKLTPPEIWQSEWLRRTTSEGRRTAFSKEICAEFQFPRHRRWPSSS